MKPSTRAGHAEEQPVHCFETTIGLARQIHHEAPCLGIKDHNDCYGLTKERLNRKSAKHTQFDDEAVDMADARHDTVW